MKAETFRWIHGKAKRWRPKWDNPFAEVEIKDYIPLYWKTKDGTMIEYQHRKLTESVYEAGADAMRKADIGFLKKYLVERPATGKVRIIMDIEDWLAFIGEEK